MIMEARIAKLERDINRLKTEYDQYFAGVLKLPPTALETEVAREVRSLSTTPVSNTANRFRLRQLVSRYNVYLQYWQKNLRDMDEGRVHQRRAQSRRQPGDEGIRIVSPDTDKAQMEALFRVMRREYDSLGQGKMPDPLRLRKLITEQTKAIQKRYSCLEVSYQVVTEGGKVKIKAKPVR